MKADLHVHTNISDGSMSIQEVVNEALLNGVTHLGITNHDAVRELKEAIEVGIRAHINIIPGIEISACDFSSGRKIHILGYNFNLEAENIRKLCDPVLDRRHKNSIWQIEQLINLGYKINVDDIYARAEKSKVIYKQHIMAELIDKKYTDGIYSSLYKKLFKGDGVCAKDIEYVDACEAVKAIKMDGGIAVLAHPGQLNSYPYIEKLVEAGLNGIELFHQDHNDEDHMKIKTYCSKYKLITTGGSDFHGSYGSEIRVGEITSDNEI